MLRKMFFYSNMFIAAVLFPIVGVLFTVAYTTWVIVRGLVRVLPGMRPRRAS